MRRLLIRRISICLVVSHDCAVTQHISSFGLLTLHLGATPCSTRQSRCNIGICSRPRRAQLMMTVVGSLSSSCSTLAPSEDQDCAMWTESSLECSAAASAAVAVAWGGLVRGPVSSGGHCRRRAGRGSHESHWRAGGRDDCFYERGPPHGKATSRGRGRVASHRRRRGGAGVAEKQDDKRTPAGSG